jgi:hypothetical protein
LLSRRKFIATGGAAVVIVGSTLYLKPDILTHYLCKSNPKNYDDLLTIGQETSPAALDYPGLNEYDVVTKVELLNTANKPLEKLQIVQKAPEGFELKSAKWGRAGQFERDYEALQPKVLDNTAVCSLTETLKPNERYTVAFTHTPGWEAKSGDFQAAATAQLYAELYEPCWISELLHIEPQKDYVGINSNTTSATVTVNPAPKPLKEIYELGKKDWAKDIAKRKILMQYPVAAELQNKFWIDPIEHAGEAIDYLQSELDKAGQPFNELAKELDKIPEITGTTKYKVEKIDVVKGVENLTSAALLYDTPKENIVAMLDEGNEEVRKCSTPLQALLWLGRNTVFSKQDNPLNPYNLNSLLIRAWNPTFGRDEWKDFKEVTTRLNSPRCVYFFMSKNFRYDGSEHGWQTPSITFNKRSGHCGDQADFACHCLNKNGYEARKLWVKWGSGWFDQHTVCIFRKEKFGDLFYLDNASPTGSNGIFGPFTSTENIAHSISRGPIQQYGTM